MAHHTYLLAACVAGVAGLAATAGAQSSPKPHVAVAIIAARPADIASIEAIVRADYESISGGVGVPRQWARDFSLYDPYARSFTPYKDAKTGALMIWNPTEQEYADATDSSYVTNGFSEHELAHKIVRYGNVATVFSSYEGGFVRGGREATRGVNTYQLYFDGKRWWISSVSWDGSKSINEIPPDLLPKQ